MCVLRRSEQRECAWEVQSMAHSVLQAPRFRVLSPFKNNCAVVVQRPSDMASPCLDSFIGKMGILPNLGGVVVKTKGKNAYEITLYHAL